MLRRTALAALAALPLAVLCACGPRVAAWGVVLWGPSDGEPRTGRVVPVVRAQAINSAVLIAVPGEKAPREFLQGRLRVFAKKADAAAFAAGAYAPFTGSWAIVTKTDDPPLPVRVSAAADAQVVYKLAPRQLVKVVGRSAEQATVKPYTDWWYEVVTEDGYGGWCFGHYLKAFTVDGDPAAEADRLRAQDDVLARIMGSAWRPDWFADMAAKSAYDLTMFREDVGLFPSAEETVIRLVLPLQSFEFAYTGAPQKQGALSYSFPGTELRIDALDRDVTRINVTYRQKDQLVTRMYVTMDADIAGIITAEQERRAAIYAGLTARGRTLSSSAYGTLKLGEDMRFTWEGFARLVPSLVKAGVRGSGAVDLSLKVAKAIAADYDGALTLVFDDAPAAPVSFLYKAAADGLRLTSLARDSVTDLHVTHASPTPIVIFFGVSP